METQLRPLLDAIEINHGPKIELGRYFLQLAEEARKLGISLHMGRGSDRLNEVNKHHQDTWEPLAPVYNPDLSGINEDNAIYVEGQHEGDPVATLILRRYDWPKSTLREEWEAGRFAYRDPDAQMDPQEKWIAEAPMASSISGRVVFAGGLWCHPSFRRKRVPVLTVALMRSISLAVWNPDFAIGMIKTGPLARMLLPLYGNPPVQPGMKITGAWSTFESILSWETPAVLTNHVLRNLAPANQPNHRDRANEGIRSTGSPR
ncbi:hypothetical protein GLI01_23700 [Gluconacetobacter liquefaciens]|uniref:N-acetyltransferase domain-containing protein n=1 Tax=Gluconacetobacter liquefaciens TaxID=89584 RepID=A0A370G2S5_GLULI|nr:hypothetical protein [Gluconacetobacter liquefaciens]MBB2186463.1 hypothetical protein [Gluconacetobacter liquefaciens]RDI38128.1 hypothetical protein C7453_10465 [Gluconacetobacter liquefaciens]GBR04023.1 hypothetical protein AA0522_1832 [Gluconacetobacter liquefaciens NRIC 0522]GEB38335.1 hypothetical protein GLI01_23700 [Gluconacetobacter liquefaciens]